MLKRKRVMNVYCLCKNGSFNLIARIVKLMVLCTLNRLLQRVKLAIAAHMSLIDSLVGVIRVKHKEG